MKKLISLIISLSMICSIGFAVLAAGSPDGVVDVSGGKDADGNSIEVTIEDTDVPLCTPEIASRLTGVPASELKLLWQKNLSSETLPATFTFTCNGTDDKPLYVIHYNGSDWELITSGTGPSVTATFTDLSPVALFVREAETPTATPAADGADKPTSPKTEDNSNVSLLLIIAVIAASAALITKLSARKFEK
ncbi:MAG: hypothetical protein MJ153_08945 [Clostridia bacterium]|nr:hypothetical protein [Clostridia bacterium]